MNDLISRQAAIEKIHWLGLDNDTTIKCDLAIRALSSVNTQEAKMSNSENPSEDAISRQAELDGLASIAKAKAKSDAQKSLMGRIMFFTERLPSVNPQQKTGHWKQISPARIYECDICGQNVMTDDISAYRYCHGCGTKMVEPRESEA